MSKKNLLLIGGGGHCRACIDVIEMEGKYTICGILDEAELVGGNVLGYEIIGTDDLISSYVKNGFSFILTVGQIKSAHVRRRIFDHLKALNADVVTVISPLASVSKYAILGRGTIVMHNVTISAGVSIGENNILNTGCNIEHDTRTGDHCHISTHAVINGNCTIGNEVFIGSNVTVSNQIFIDSEIFVGAGAVVHKDLRIKGKYVGNPARKLST